MAAPKYMEMTIEECALSLIKPTGLVGTSVFEEGFVELCWLIRAQQETDNPKLFTAEMQVSQ